MLHAKLKEIRKRNGYTQDEVAEKLNVVRQTVSKWESGLSVPDADSLSRLAELYGISIYDLLDTAPRPRADALPETETARSPRPQTNQQERQVQKMRTFRNPKALALTFAAVLVCVLAVLFTRTPTPEAPAPDAPAPVNAGTPSQDDYGFDTFEFSDLQPGERVIYEKSITLPEPGTFKCQAIYDQGLFVSMGLISQDGTRTYYLSNPGPGSRLTDAFYDVPAGEYQVFIQNDESSLQYARIASSPLTISGTATFGFAFG